MFKTKSKLFKRLGFDHAKLPLSTGITAREGLMSVSVIIFAADTGDLKGRMFRIWKLMKMAHKQPLGELQNKEVMQVLAGGSLIYSFTHIKFGFIVKVP